MYFCVHHLPVIQVAATPGKWWMGDEQRCGSGPPVLLCSPGGLYSRLKRLQMRALMSVHSSIDTGGKVVIQEARIWA